MIVVPGFSVSELIKAVNTTASLCKSIKSAAREIQSLSDLLVSSSKCLEDVKEAIVSGKTGYYERRLEDACNQYQNTLEELRSHLEKYKTGGGSTREKLEWVLREWYNQTSKGYRSRIKSHERAIIFSLTVDMYIAIISQNHKGVSERVGVPLAPQGEKLGDSPLEPISPGHCTNPPNDSNEVTWRKTIYRQPEDFPDPPSQDPRLPPQVPDIEVQDKRPRNSGTRESVGSDITDPESIFSNPDFSRPSTPGSSVTSIPSTILIEAKPQPPRPFPPGISARPRRESDPQAPAPIDTVPFSGEVRLYAKPYSSSSGFETDETFSWYGQASGQYIRVSALAAEKGGRGNVRMLSTAGEEIRHTLLRRSSRRPSVDHPQRFEHISQSDAKARYLVRFSGSRNNRGDSERVISFEKMEGMYNTISDLPIDIASAKHSPYRYPDCIGFQRCAVGGKDLLWCAEVSKIKSSRSDLEGIWTTLQLWESRGIQTIKFLSNEEKAPLEFKTARLSVTNDKPGKPGKLKLKLKFRKTGAELEKLEKLEKQLKFLDIEFTEQGIDIAGFTEAAEFGPPD